MTELTSFQKFKQSIVQILTISPQRTGVILRIIKEMYPDECNDQIRCIHNDIDYKRPEWEHITRSAQQALKKSDIIFLDNDKLWKIVKTETIEKISETIKDIEEPQGIPTESDDLDEFVGEPMDLGVMRWSPITHDGVIALFVEYRKELGFPIIEWIRPQFPDACVYKITNKPRASYVKKYVEFELYSSLFKEHTLNQKHSKRKCDYVICWENDWKDCPIPVIELKSEILRIRKERRS